MKRRERIITDESQVPDGWVPMRNYKDPDYHRVKVAVWSGELEALALFPDGMTVKHPRKWVREKEVGVFLDSFPGNGKRRTTKAEAPQAAAPQAESQLVPMFRDLIATIDLLSVAVADLTAQLKTAPAAQAERDLFSVRN